MRVPIMLERTDAAPPGPGPFNTVPPGRADESGAFRTYGVPPGKYIVRVGSSPAAAWILKSVTIEGRDVSEVPITLRAAEVANAVITFTDRPTKLTGTVRAAGGNPDSDALVIVFPVEPSGWTQFGLNPRRLRSTRPSKTGVYTFTGLPAGDYYVAAIKEDGIAQWQDPQFLEDASRIGNAGQAPRRRHQDAGSQEHRRRPMTAVAVVLAALIAQGTRDVPAPATRRRVDCRNCRLRRAAAAARCAGRR